MSKWDPFGDLMTIQDRMNRLFHETLARQQGQEAIEAGQWAPAVDIYEDAGRVVLQADLPGVAQEAIELRVDDNVLVLRGERRRDGAGRPEAYHRTERPHGTFVRSFALPRNIEQSGIKATQRNGVLEVVLPKKQEAVAKAIRVEVK
jgi:HSP20 family protein